MENYSTKKLDPLATLEYAQGAEKVQSMKTKQNISLSRQYIAMCQTLNHRQYFFRSFSLPEWHYNTLYQAEKYAMQFLPNVMLCIPSEQYQDCEPVKPALLPKQLALAMKVGL